MDTAITAVMMMPPLVILLSNDLWKKKDVADDSGEFVMSLMFLLLSHDDGETGHWCL